ncbi:alpha/beta hydrolase family protein [Chitinophaga sp. 30R24]|uniref:alpha/beta hydrolase family protein n=1 Tax=Chitinophaga sp. 30R24 TaxID=3248838 RepID=UPI003B91AFB7
MNNRTSLLLLFIVLSHWVFGQKQTLNDPGKYLGGEKKVVDSRVYNTWPSYDPRMYISNDGKFVMYFETNPSLEHTTLCVQSVKGNWLLKLKNIDDAFFSNNSQSVYFINRGDSLCTLKLGTNLIDYIPNVIALNSDALKRDLLIYELKGNDTNLVVKNLRNESKSSYSFVKRYWLSDNDDKMILQFSGGNTNGIDSLVWINLNKHTRYAFWQGRGVEKVVFNDEATQIAYITADKSEKGNKKAIWYYTEGAKGGDILLTDSMLNTNELVLNDILRFSKEGKRLFFNCKDRLLPLHKVNDESTVEVWSYKDAILQSEQVMALQNGGRSYLMVVNVEHHQLLRIEGKSESVMYWDARGKDDFFLVQEAAGMGPSETSWNEAWRSTWYEVSTISEKRERMSLLDTIPFLFVSKEAKFLIYQNKEQTDYFTYEIATGVVRNITGKIKTDWTRKYGPGIEKWLDNDEGVIINDHNDVWILDPKGEKAALNLTHGYGRGNDIVFFLLDIDSIHRVPVNGDRFIFSAFNNQTKDNGFYGVTVGKSQAPELLTMGPYLYFAKYHPDFFPVDLNRDPVKAKDAQLYLVKRSSARESGNYYVTADFKTYAKLTNLHPESNYNWLVPELHTWTSLDGHSLQGILYKPENFDATKKYPVIFEYYERKSDRLNVYIAPEALSGYCSINIPTYVSNGYLVFCPDIRYDIGDPMQGTYDAVISAAHYMARKDFVDSCKMAITGCSWGGIQTNYLVTHSGLFAAANANSSLGDWVSDYSALSLEGHPRQGIYEIGQCRMGSALWDKKDIYLKSSPVLSADKVTTPLLLMQGKNDPGCAFSNAMEFFTSLRRLGKRSWLLAYNAGHGLFGGPDVVDFSIRQRQFFDHYLKGTPPPKWMMEGVPAEKRGVESGLGLYDKYVTPGVGLLRAGK